MEQLEPTWAKPCGFPRAEYSPQIISLQLSLNNNGIIHAYKEKKKRKRLSIKGDVRLYKLKQDTSDGFESGLG